MRSEARKQTRETLPDHMQAFGSRETAIADPITPALDEELGYLTHHRIFACLSGNCSRLPVRRAIVPSGPIEKRVRRNR